MKFEKRLALTGYLRKIFGVSDIHDKNSVKAYYKRFKEDASGSAYDANGISKVCNILKTIPRVTISEEKLLEYDGNIRSHLEKINKNRATKDQIVFKYFQFLAGFYTEYYLDRVTEDKPAFLKELNAFVAEQKKNNGSKIQYAEFEESDLNKVAYWMATGSGKTLILHLNYYQFQHYMPRLDEAPDNILLITPNAGLTNQHQKELNMSGIPNRYYLDGNGTSGIEPETVKLIEITKLTDEKKGDGDSVEVSAFEGNNLIFVDEGHKGSSTEDSKWMARRKAISESGFTFEYSATFGQSLNKAAASVQDEYGKAIVFDYAYPRFYEDGYGKNYQILNLRKKQHFDDKDQRHVYLMANLLSFYEQKYVYGQDAETFYKTWNLHDPLLTFIGHSVQAGKTKSSLAKDEKRTVSDVQKIVLFLNLVLQNENDWTKNTIQDLLSGTSGITGPDDSDIFENSFTVLKERFKEKADDIYSDLLETLFHVKASAPLKLSNIKSAEGEIGLRAGNSDHYFGVINIGEDSVFLQFVEENLPDLIVEEGDTFQGSLFQQINKQHSPINMLIGSRKFIEGWSSWRVANMGLMNIGKSEGPQIIQLFGRGVRLLGKDRSLMRSSEMTNIPKPDHIELLETLQIFGLQANYMEQFRKYLKEEGIDVEERVNINLKIQFPNSFENKGLLVIKPKIREEFQDVVQLVLRNDEKIKPKIDLTSTIEVEASDDRVQEKPAAGETEQKMFIRNDHIPLLDFERLYREAWRYRSQKGYRNLSFDIDTLRSIIQERSYELYCDEDLLEVKSFSDVKRLEEIALIILRKYVDSWYKRRQQEWEYTQLEYHPFKENDKNIPNYSEDEQGYQLRVKKTAVDKIEKEIKALFSDTEVFETDVFKGKDGSIPRIYFDRHIYLPLLIEDKNEIIQSTPPGLNEGEWKFLKDMKKYFQSTHAEKLFEGYDVFVLRNQSRGHGIGFLLAEERYFPDFIVWVKNEVEQHICFMDPKGLQHQINVNENNKVQFSKEIKSYEKQLNDKRGNEQVQLHSFIISQTDLDEVKKNNSVQSVAELNEMNIYFPEQDGYVDGLFRRVLNLV
ncbi:DEAD/DEAH box helicase family protein [Rhodohalobacter halophilus]|uniref:DEAD/DEAH box helicase family protein n=1 Tax=Rhodohalobacter halophilus TaxID=1812810 RepID=UPI00083FAC5F|nr:DEAD/DEAH box helicase family protein [Rhodohalobacter halophilus]